MTITDSIYNTKIVYLYVNKFDYGKNQLGKEEASGHPKSKKVYRAIYNTDTDSYRVIYEVKDRQVYMAFVQDLQSNNEELGYTCDIKVITVENILDFELPEKELDQLLSWLKTDNKDLKDILGDIGKKPEKEKKVNSSKESQVPKKAINQQKYPQELVDVARLTANLHQTDPLMFGTVFDLLVYLNENVYADNGPVNTGWLKLDKEHGAGVNVSAAIDKLSKYLGKDRRTNLDNADLMGALNDLMIEKSRRNFHEIT